MDVCVYEPYRTLDPDHRLLLWLWFNLNPGILLVILYYMNLSNNMIAYIYNNILTSNKPPCGRGESLGTAHIGLISFHNSIFIFIAVWVGRTVALSPSYP